MKKIEYDYNEMAALDIDKPELKEEADDFAMITIQSQSQLFYTTYQTLKRIPFLESLYSRWHDKTQPLFVDAPASLIEELLAENTIITREYLGLVKESKTQMIDYTKFDQEKLKIIINNDGIQFIYRNLSQYWAKQKDGSYSCYGRGHSKSDYFPSITREALTDYFRTRIFPTMSSRNSMIVSSS